MELEFDKEIDAILRRSGRGVLVGDKPIDKPKHLDADAIAAFVENAVPDKMRRLYTEHFADCDRCRKLLSNSILMHQTAASMAAVGAAEVVSAPAAEAAPWYRGLFRTPNLAMAMGVLVIAFAGILGYVVLQNRNADSNASIAQSSNKAATSNIPTYSDAAPQSNSNAAAANVPAMAANSANTMAAVPAEPMSVNKGLAGPSASGEGNLDSRVAAQPEAEKEIATAAAPAVEQPKPVAAAPPAPVDDKTPPGAVAGAARTEEAKDEDATLAKRKLGEESRRDMPAPPAKAGPVRSAGPVQNQSNQVQSNIFDMPVTRVVGGKTFENRNGAWYDRAYKGQSTTSVRRGTDQYKNLDKGLRSIADDIGGTVVIVWKDKAYRIN